ncbi:MAG: hypothetical protein HS116_02945 [Planctomycetes bacterium]|nr:hypothetical protein [Planctomycetota bacterium]
MRQAWKRTSIWLVLAMALVGLASAGLCANEEGGGEGEQEDLDYIKLNSGATRGTKITRDDYMLVEGLHNKIPIKEKTYNIEDVLYADRDSNYIRGMDYRAKGKFLTAAKLFRASLESIGGKSKWAKEYCNYYIGDCFYQNGTFTGYTDKGGTKYEPASVYFQECLKAKPKSRFALDCYVKLVLCLAEEGKLDEADKAFEAAKAFTKTFSDEARQVDSRYLDEAKRAVALATLGKAKMQERREDAKANEKERDYNQALSNYRNTQGEARGKFPQIYADACEGELEVLVKMADGLSEAISRAEGLIASFKEKADPELIPVLPAAYGALGRANFMKGVKFKDQKQDLQAETAFAEARWSFLHVVVQFFDKDDHVARAHYFAGACYKEMIGKEPDAQAKAIRHWKTVVEDYGTSVFVDFAKQGLTELGAGAAPAPAPEGEKKPEGAAPEGTEKKTEEPQPKE